MARKPLALIPMLSIMVIFSNCKVTKKAVCGVWTYATDTLLLKENNTFSYNSTSLASVSGTWTLSNKLIYLNFNNSQDEQIFGGCQTVQVFKHVFGKMKMARGASCVGDKRSVPDFFLKLEPNWMSAISCRLPKFDVIAEGPRFHLAGSMLPGHDWEVR